MQFKLRHQRVADALARDSAMQALRAHFTGAGAKWRTLHSAWRITRSTAALTSLFIMFGSWAIIAGVAVGPEHEMLLREVYKWLMTVPFDELVNRVHAIAHESLWYCLQLAVMFSVCKELVKIADPAKRDVVGQAVC